MNIETQLQFINSEIAQCDTKKAALQAIRDTITGLAAPELASLQGLTSENATLKQENQTLKTAPVEAVKNDVA